VCDGKKNNFLDFHGREHGKDKKSPLVEDELLHIKMG
jgi:hypothetical protein